MLLCSHGLQAGPETWPVHVVGVTPASRSEVRGFLGSSDHFSLLPVTGAADFPEARLWQYDPDLLGPLPCLLQLQFLHEKAASVQEQIRPIQHAACSVGLTC